MVTLSESEAQFDINGSTTEDVMALDLFGGKGSVKGGFRQNPGSRSKTKNYTFYMLNRNNNTWTFNMEGLRTQIC